jgi:very-short-patch-repair endonuclease
MRSEPTEAEHRLWQILRAKRFLGYKFRRQVPIDFYIADFICLSERLIIELDGYQHSDNRADLRRDAYLRSQGFRIIRIWNNDLFTNEEGVGELILSVLRVAPSPQPLSREGRGAKE